MRWRKSSVGSSEEENRNSQIISWAKENGCWESDFRWFVDVYLPSFLPVRGLDFLARVDLLETRWFADREVVQEICCSAACACELHYELDPQRTSIVVTKDFWLWEMAMQRWSNQYPGTSPQTSNNWKGQMKSSKNSQSPWSLYADPEMKRKKRVATYKVLTVEGKMKQTVRNSCRWLKAKFIEARYGWWWWWWWWCMGGGGQRPPPAT